MVDVQEHCMEAASLVLGIKALRRLCKCEKIGVDKAATRVTRKDGAKGHHVPLVPSDDGFERIDHNQRGYLFVFECGGGGVAEAEPADDHIPCTRIERVEAEIGEGDFHLMEHTGHQKRFAKFDLKDFKVVQRRHKAAAQRQISQGGLLIIQFFESLAHGGSIGASARGNDNIRFR